MVIVAGEVVEIVAAIVVLVPVLVSPLAVVLLVVVFVFENIFQDLCISLFVVGNIALTSMSLPTSLVMISSYTFFSCSSLKTAAIPK